MNTYDNPGCYHALLNRLSTTTGITRTKELGLNKIDSIYRTTKMGKKKLQYAAAKIKVVVRGAGTVEYYDNGKRWDEKIDKSEFVGYLVEINRPINEFGIEVLPAGKYKDDCGGGAYYAIQRVLVDGEYFAPNMECRC